MDSALDSELDSALDSGFDSDSALELPDVLDDADEELLVLWEELLPELPEELPEDELLELPELAEEEAGDAGQAVYLVDTHAREQRLKHGEQTAVVRLG